MDPRGLSTSAHLLRLSSLGFALVLSILLGLGLGWLLRKFLHLGDWVVVAGIVLGVLAGFYNLIQELMALNKKGKTPP